MILRWVAVASILLGAWAAPLPAGASPAAGHTYTVNSTLDEPDADPTNGGCSSTPAGACTLRAAIMQSNHDSGPNTILLSAGTYTLTRKGNDDTAQLGDLDIGFAVTLQGAGSAATIVDGNGAVIGDRVFNVLNWGQDVTFIGMTIRNGHAPPSPPGGAGGDYLPYSGGGIKMEGAGHLVLRDVILEGNTALHGGGLFADLNGGIVSLEDSQVYSNSASGQGGGLAVFSIFSSLSQIKRSEIYSNTASAGGGIAGQTLLSLVDSHVHDNSAVIGGGIYNTGLLTLAASTLSGNVASQTGGGIHNISGQLTLINSTLSGNVSGEAGGGLYAFGGQTQLLNATIAGNLVQYTVAIQPGLGGGVYLTRTAAFTARNSIIANNWRNSRRVPRAIDDCSSVDSNGDLYYDLFTTLENCTLFNGKQIGNIVGPDPLLGLLQNNGGSTPTRALQTGSPAIDAADPAGCVDWTGSPLTMDQRAAARVDAHCDMGAYELVPEADVAVGQRDNPDPVRPGAPLTYTISVTNTGPDQATSVQLIDTLPLSVTVAAATPSQGSCQFTAPVVCNMGALASGAPATVTLVVTPTTVGWMTNRITVNATVFDPRLANNSANETTAVAPQADLAVSQRDSPDPARMGAPLTYTVGLTNAGPDPAIAVVLTDTLPLSAVLETAAPSQGSCAGVVIVTCNLGSIASGDHVTVTVAVTPTAGGLMTNLVIGTANDLDPALENNSASETTNVVAPRRMYLPLVRR